jgi:hypothetical protein
MFLDSSIKNRFSNHSSDANFWPTDAGHRKAGTDRWLPAGPDCGFFSRNMESMSKFPQAHCGPSRKVRSYNPGYTEFVPRVSCMHKSLVSRILASGVQKYQCIRKIEGSTNRLRKCDFPPRGGSRRFASTYAEEGVLSQHIETGNFELARYELCNDCPLALPRRTGACHPSS